MRSVLYIFKGVLVYFATHHENNPEINPTTAIIYTDSANAEDNDEVGSRADCPHCSVSD